MVTRKEWMIIAALSLMISIGCSHEQVAKATAEINPKPNQENAAAPSPLAPGAIVVSQESGPSFVSNDNLQPVYFELSKSPLDEKALMTLKANANWLQQNTPFMIRIIAFTDSRGSSRKNHWLAEQRALHVRDAYVSLGIAKNRILITGLGQETSACSPATEECLAKSRRAETLIENKTTALR